MYPIEPLFYQNNLDTTSLKKNPMSTKDIFIEKQIVVITGTVDNYYS